MRTFRVTVKPNLKAAFFDRPLVLKRVEAAKRRNLSKFGAFIRRESARSMRWRRKNRRPSPPGRPPYAHVGKLKRFIWFGYDRQRDSVVVGPVGFKGSQVPNILEFGGTTRRVDWDRTRALWQAQPGGRGLIHRRVRVRARPYMAPALRKELPKFPSLWLNSIRVHGG